MSTVLTNKTILTKHSTKAKLKLASPHTLIIYLLNLFTGTDTTISERNTKPGYQESELQSTRVENRHRISFQIHLSILQDRGGTTLVIINNIMYHKCPSKPQPSTKLLKTPKQRTLSKSHTSITVINLSALNFNRYQHQK